MNRGLMVVMSLLCASAVSIVSAGDSGTIAGNALVVPGPNARRRAVRHPGPVLQAPYQPIYSIPKTRSRIPTPTSTIPPGPRVNDFSTPYGDAPKGFEFADFNGDGYLDIFVAPAFANHLPTLPIAIWVNRGDGTFYDGTAEIIEGTPPVTWNATQILIGDVNHDGRPDVVVLSSGAEHLIADGFLDTGFHNTLLLSQPNGKYRDATEQLASNAKAFNHHGGMGDANGDGNLDFVVNSMGTAQLDARGLKLLYGDGAGTFIDATSALPPEVRHMPWEERISDPVTYNSGYQDLGSAALADLDGDGKAEVITASYSWQDIAPDGTDVERTIRFHKMGIDGKFTERGRVRIPGALASINSGRGDGSRLGANLVLGGDFNGDGRTDLLVQWEGEGLGYVEILRNDGNFHFTDITLYALGKYDQGYLDWGTTPQGAAIYRLLDANGDGTLDIVGQLGNSSIKNVLLHAAYLNDGRAHFSPWSPQGQSGALEPICESVERCSDLAYIPFMFDTNKSGLASLVLLDFQSSFTATSYWEPCSCGTAGDKGCCPSQTSAVYLTVFTPTDAPRPTSTKESCR